MFSRRASGVTPKIEQPNILLSSVLQFDIGKCLLRRGSFSEWVMREVVWYEEKSCW
jgi:hypothetical protein